MKKESVVAAHTQADTPTILLLMEAEADRRETSLWLSDLYHVAHGSSIEDLRLSFDLCVLDDSYHDRVRNLIARRKAREGPILLPFLLLTSEKSRSSLSELPVHEVDEVLEAPISPELLVTRIGVLIERRRRDLAFKAENERATAALAASEARLRALHESLRDGFVQVAMDGRIIDTNEAYQSMLGYSAEELKTLRYTDLTPEPWHAKEQRIVEEQVMTRGYSEVYEKEYRRRDRTVIPVELRTILLRDAAGTPHSMWATVREISERKRQQARLEEALETARLSQGKLEQAITTIERAHEHELRARARAEALLMTATAIASGITLKEVLDSVCDVILRTTPHLRVTVSLFEGSENRLVIVASKGSGPGRVGLSSGYERLSERVRAVLRERKADVIDYDAIRPEERGAAEEVGACLAFVVPLVYRGRTVGLLTVDDPGMRAEFDTFEKEFYEGVGAQAAVAIENARLYEAEHESSQFAAEIAERRASLLSREGTAGALNETLEHGVELLKAQAGALFSADEGAAESQQSIGDASLLERPWVATFTRSATARLIGERSSNRPVGVQSAEIADESGATTYVAVMLTSDPDCRSSVAFVRENDPFRSHEFEFVRQLADTLGLATQEQRVRREREWLSSARQEWLAGISHDLRTPLSTIRGYAMLLADEHDTPPEEIRRQAEIIISQTQRIQSLVSDMLLMFQIREGRLPVDMEQTDIVSLLAGVEESLQADPRSQGRELLFNLPEGPRWAYVDGRLLERAVQNVAANAIVHNPEGTTVRLELGSCNGWEEIVVSDDGLGMDEATLARVWARYERATGAGSDTDGVGLGMSITRQLIERMGGEVAVQSAPGEGTTIRMRVPRSADSIN